MFLIPHDTVVPLGEELGVARPAALLGARTALADRPLEGSALIDSLMVLEEAPTALSRRGEDFRSTLQAAYAELPADGKTQTRGELCPFRFRDPRTGKWVRARYVATLAEIEARYREWEIIGPAEIRGDVLRVLRDNSSLLSRSAVLHGRHLGHLPEDIRKVTRRAEAAALCHDHDRKFRLAQQRLSALNTLPHDVLMRRHSGRTLERPDKLAQFELRHGGDFIEMKIAGEIIVDVITRST